jgi:hypothetical protein
MSTSQGKKPTYHLTNEFRVEDMFAALNRAGPPSQEAINKWRAEEAERQSDVPGKSRHWHLRFGKSRGT